MQKGSLERGLGMSFMLLINRLVPGKGLEPTRNEEPIYVELQARLRMISSSTFWRLLLSFNNGGEEGWMTEKRLIAGIIQFSTLFRLTESLL